MNKELEDKIKIIIINEGGDKYTNNPKDKGGPTRYGITEVTARAFGYKGDMRELPYETAFIIYTTRFWFAPKFDRIEPVSMHLSFVLFDWGVNAGPGRPSKALQRCLNVLNREARDYPDIEPDGNIGNITLHALNEFVKKQGQHGLLNLIEMIVSLRSVFYIELAEKDSTQEEFENGWQNRTFTR